MPEKTHRRSRHAIAAARRLDAASVQLRGDAEQRLNTCRRDVIDDWQHVLRMAISLRPDLRHGSLVATGQSPQHVAE